MADKMAKLSIMKSFPLRCFTVLYLCHEIKEGQGIILMSLLNYCEISGSHSGAAKVPSLLLREAVSLDKFAPTFPRNAVPPSSESSRLFG